MASIRGKSNGKTSGHSEESDHPVCIDAITPGEAAGYISDMASGLADIARSRDLGFLSLLIDQVRTEAETIARNSGDVTRASD